MVLSFGGIFGVGGFLTYKMYDDHRAKKSVVST
jgi:hypothetical protein